MVERDPYCRKVLAKHWPGVPILEDIFDVTKETLENAIESYRRCQIQCKETERSHSCRPSSGISGRSNGGGKEETLTDAIRSGSDSGTERVRRQTGSDTGGRSAGSGMGSITLVTGGFPCQPFSVAGKRQGKDDDRHLWPQMRRVIQEVKPTWVVAENVAGIVGMVEFDSPLELDKTHYTENEMAAGYLDVGRVCERVGRGVLDEIVEDLEADGYEVQACVVPACAVNAPHRRDRIFIVAHDNSVRCDVRDTTGEGIQAGSESRGQVGPGGSDVADAAGKRRRERRPEPEVRGRHSSLSSDSSDVTNADIDRLQDGVRGIGSGECEAGTSEGRPVEGCGESWWSTEPDVGRVATGVPARVDRLRALGNAVVPQQIYPILKAIADIENSRCVSHH